jgi:hypothetical protein
MSNSEATLSLLSISENNLTGPLSKGMNINWLIYANIIFYWLTSLLAWQNILLAKFNETQTKLLWRKQNCSADEIPKSTTFWRKDLTEVEYDVYVENYSL